MAHTLKDSMNHYAIELKRGPKNVQCIVRLNGEVEFKTYPLTKMITDHEYATNDGTYQFDRRWNPCTEEQDSGCTLLRVIDNFLSGMLPVTPKARRWLEVLRDNPDSTQPTEGEDEMRTKKAKTKKAPGEKAPAERKAKFAPDTKITLIAEKNFHEGSVRGKCFAVIQKHKELTVAEYLKHCSGREIKKAQALSCLAKLVEPEQKVQTVKVG